MDRRTCPAFVWESKAYELLVNYVTVSFLPLMCGSIKFCKMCEIKNITAKYYANYLKISSIRSIPSVLGCCQAKMVEISC